MFLRQIYLDSLAQASYLIGCPETGEAIVIDPARDVDTYLELAASHGLRIVAGAETHIHADFLSGARELAEVAGARLYLSDEGDADWKYRWLDQRSDGGSYDHRLLHEGDTFRVGGIEFRVLHTPGHTPEHISFLVTDAGGGADQPIGMLTGDFVFVGDLGRPDLLETAAGIPGVKEAAARTLAVSARRFLDQPDFLQIWPAHGAGSACGKALGAVPQTTVGYERRFNAALRVAGDDRAFAEFILEGQPEPPLYFARMKQENRDGVKLLGVLPRPRLLSGEEIVALDGRKIFVVDTRSWDAFRDGHLDGALFAPLGNVFHTVVGSYIQPEDEIVLVAEAAYVDGVVRELVRIGLDRITGFATPEDIEQSGVSLAEVPEMSAAEAGDALEGGELPLLDVRRRAELASGSIGTGTPQVAHTRLPLHLDQVPSEGKVLVYCASGRRSAAAVSYLRRAGYDAVNLAGGMASWRAGDDKGAPAAGKDA